VVGAQTGLHCAHRAAAIHTGGRETEADTAHLLEGIAVIAYDPSSAMIESSSTP
jgi:hypothetical protein